MDDNPVSRSTRAGFVQLLTSCEFSERDRVVGATRQRANHLVLVELLCNVFLVLFLVVYTNAFILSLKKVSNLFFRFFLFFLSFVVGSSHFHPR